MNFLSTNETRFASNSAGLRDKVVLFVDEPLS
jgi:hypothetical protein